MRSGGYDLWNGSCLSGSFLGVGEEKLARIWVKWLHVGNFFYNYF
jgi:hypothetical protein